MLRMPRGAVTLLCFLFDCLLQATSTVYDLATEKKVMPDYLTREEMEQRQAAWMKQFAQAHS